jgi:triosephosphate isomerase
MRRRLVVGNWKMHGTLAEIGPLVRGVLAGAASVEAEVAVCPPFVYLPFVAESLKGSKVALGAQNLSDQESGAFTGEVSGIMLKDYNCRFVIVGHSERRTLFGESDDVVAKKFAMALRRGLTPILCVGELLEERETGRTWEVVERQLRAVFGLAGVSAFNEAVIAYEPVWAIGSGRTATPELAQEVHAFIRGLVAHETPEVAERLPVLYGGSVKASNAKGLFAMADIDGGLIGGASLMAEEFLAICRAA